MISIRQLTAIICGITFLGFSQTALAGRAECQDAISQYNSAISDISTALRRYTNCVSGSNGQDDCSSEFRRLRSAQSDFEDAVSRYGLECN
jgi:hypothetical protein